MGFATIEFSGGPGGYVETCPFDAARGKRIQRARLGRRPTVTGMDGGTVPEQAPSHGLRGGRRPEGWSRSGSPRGLDAAITGELTPQNVLKVQAKGPSFDGRQFFHSLLLAGKISDNQPAPPKDEPGLDLGVEIDTGWSINDVRISFVDECR